MSVAPDPASTVHLELIIGLVERQRLPTIYPYPYFVRNGGLISYGIDNSDLWRRAASYVDRILNGETPLIELSRVKQPSDDQEDRLWGFNVWRHLYFQWLGRSKNTTPHNLNVSSSIFEAN